MQEAYHPPRIRYSILLSYPRKYPIPGWGDLILEYPQARTGVPPRRDLEPVTGIPLKRTWDQQKYYEMEMGCPRGVNWQTNWNYYLPHPSDAGGNEYHHQIM